MEVNHPQTGMNADIEGIPFASSPRDGGTGSFLNKKYLQKIEKARGENVSN